MSDENMLFLLGILLGIFIGGFIVGLIDGAITDPIGLSQKTGDEICINITGNRDAIANDKNDKLECIIPSFDSTHNIIIRSNNDN